MREFFDGKIVLHEGDCRERLAELPDNSVDSCCTDPPYHLQSIVKRYSNDQGISNKGRRILNGEDAHARFARGFMGKRWDGGDIAFRPELWASVWRVLKPGAHLAAFSGTRTYHNMARAIEDAGFEIRDQLAWVYGSGFPKSHNVGDGWGTALKPAWEPIVFARKPLSEKTVAANVLRWETGAMNIDGCRAGTIEAYKTVSTGEIVSENIAMSGGNYGRRLTDEITIGRWPSNLCHDGSEEVLACFPDSAFIGGDSGSAARFFYTAKADSDDRLGSKHPTVKPVDLMQWLVRLITPKGGTCLDMFAGTGTTAEACFREGMRCILIEREEEYIADIERRMALIMAGPDERSRKSIKALGRVADAGPLFGGEQ